MLGIKPSTASTNIAENLIAQNCSDPKPYVRVTTKGGSVNVRSAPNGRIIGNIPNRWALVRVRTDSTGKWTRVTTHYADINDDFIYPSAPRFRTGWIATAFLKPIGKFCEKPVAMLRLNLNASFPNHQMLVNENWLERGDRIAKAVLTQTDE